MYNPAEGLPAPRRLAPAHRPVSLTRVASTAFREGGTPDHWGGRGAGGWRRWEGPSGGAPAPASIPRGYALFVMLRDASSITTHHFEPLPNAALYLTMRFSAGATLVARGQAVGAGGAGSGASGWQVPGRALPPGPRPSPRPGGGGSRDDINALCFNRSARSFLKPPCTFVGASTAHRPRPPPITPQQPLGKPHPPAHGPARPRPAPPRPAPTERGGRSTALSWRAPSPARRPPGAPPGAPWRRPGPRRGRRGRRGRPSRARRPPPPPSRPPPPDRAERDKT